MLFTVKKIDNWCVHASTETKIYIAEHFVLSFAIILKGGGVEFGLGSGQKA